MKYDGLKTELVTVPSSKAKKIDPTKWISSYNHEHHKGKDLTTYIYKRFPEPIDPKLAKVRSDVISLTKFIDRETGNISTRQTENAIQLSVNLERRNKRYNFVGFRIKNLHETYSNAYCLITQNADFALSALN